MTPAPDAPHRILDRIVDGVVLTEDGVVTFANRPCVLVAEAIGLGLHGTFADRLLELADRTAEPYAFTAAVERLGDAAARVEVGGAAAGRGVLPVVAGAADAGRRVWCPPAETAGREHRGGP